MSDCGSATGASGVIYTNVVRKVRIEDAGEGYTRLTIEDGGNFVMLTPPQAIELGKMLQRAARHGTSA